MRSDISIVDAASVKSWQSGNSDRLLLHIDVLLSLNLLQSLGIWCFVRIVALAAD